MAVELATAYVSLSVSTKGMGKQVTQAISGSASGAGAAADKAGASIGEKLSGAMGTAVKAGAVAAGAAAAGFIGTALTKGFQRLTAIDDAQSKLEGLGHTALGQSKIMDSALNAVRGTSYGLGEAATIAASAVAAGIKPGKDLTKYLGLTADAATIAGTSLNEMGSIINKVQTKGKAYTLDLNQLAVRGVPIYQWLADEMNVSQEALSDMVAEGKVDSATYLAAIEKNIGGAATAGNSVSAAWANTMAAMGRLGEGALKPTFSRTADWLKGAIVAIDGMTDRVKPLAAALDHRVFELWAPKIAEGAAKAGEAFEKLRESSEVRDGLARTSEVFSSMWATGEKLWPAIKSIGTSLAEASAATGVSSWRLFLTALEATAQVADAVLVPAFNAIATGAEKAKPLVAGLMMAFLAFKTVPAIMARVVPSMAAMNAAAVAGGTGLTRYQAGLMAVRNGAVGARTGIASFTRDVAIMQRAANVAGQPMGRLASSFAVLSNNVGGATGVMSRFRGVAAGASAALGGPLGIGILAAVGGYMAISSEVKKANRQQELMTDGTEGLTDAQHRLAKALNSSAGEMSDDAVSAFADRTREALRLQNEIAETGPGLLKKSWAGLATMFNDTGDFVDRVKLQDQIAKSAEAVSDVFKDLGVSNEDLAAGISGTRGQFANLGSQIDGTTNEGKNALSWLTTQRTEFLNTQAAIKNLTPEYLSIADAFKVLGDETKTAAEQSSVLFDMLQRIAGINPDLKTAIDNQNKSLREALTAAPIDQERGASSELLDDFGNVSTLTENGQELSDQLESIMKAATDAATAGRPLAEVFDIVNQSIAGSATQFGLEAEQIRRAIELLGYDEGVIRIAAILEGADGVAADIGKVWASLKSLDPDAPKVVTVDADIDPGAIDELEDMGATVEKITAADGTKQFRINLDSDEAREKLDAYLKHLADVEDFKASAELDLDTDKFNLKANESSALIGALGELIALPGVDLDLDQFKNQETVTLDALAALSDKVVNPEVLLDIIKALADAAVVDTELNRIAQQQRIAEIQVRIKGDAAIHSIDAWATAFGGEVTRRADGGAINGPGGPKQDSIPAMLSAGEHVLTASEVEAAGGQGAVYKMRQAIRAGALRFNEGGAVGNGIQKALSAGRSVTGNKYVWGGTGPTGFDCSGFVGWLQQIVMGIEGSLKRLYTTHDFFGAGASGYAGLLPGLGPAGTQFQVGVSQDHMAATVGGQTAESGGAHGASRIGAPAVGASDPQFTKQFHLPNSLIDGWVEGQSRSQRGSDEERPEWTESDELDLQDAILAVQDAKDARAKLNDPKSKATQTDRDRADIAIRRAEIKAGEKQAEKDEVAAWMPNGPAPQAPAMAEAWEKEERDRLRAQIAVDEANDKRNEVYADPLASENERLAADMDLQDAQDRLQEILDGKDTEKKTKEKLDYSLRGSMTRFGNNIVDAVVGGIFGQLPDEISSSRWIATDWNSLIPDEMDGEGSGWFHNPDDPIGNLPNPSKDKVDRQLPVTPGAKGWVEGLLKVDDFAEKIPADQLEKLRKRAPKVYDSGGWLGPGETAINLSDRPEPIFNSPDQLRQFAGQLMPAENVAPVDASVHFHGSVATRDDEELIRKIRDRQDLATRPFRRR